MFINMGKYLKLFDTHTDYNTYITGQNKILPNVSYCENENEVHYNKWTDPRLIVEYTVVDDSNPTQLYLYNNSGNEGDPVVTAEVMFEKVEIDNVEVSISTLDTAQGLYQLSEGTHTIKYTLNDPTVIGVDTSTMTVGALFMRCSTITSVTIPNSVTTIASYAFAQCSGLTSVTIPNSVTTIAAQTAFGACSGLTSIVVDSGNTTYDSRGNCNAVIISSTNTLLFGCQNTVIPNTVTTIGQAAFSGCISLTSITIPNSVTTIGQQAFYRCSGLTSVTIGNNVTTIGDYAFIGCSGFTNITIPNSVTTIGEGVFEGCSGLTSVTIPNTVTSIGEHAFGECSGLTSITIGNSVTSIGSQAFYNCTSLTNVVIPNSVTTIGYGTFSRCSSLTSITIPNSVTTISDWAFGYCTGLTSITIGSGVTSIGDSAFKNSTNLTSITLNATTPPTMMNGSSAFENTNDCPIYVPSGSVNAYKTGTNWYLLQTRIQAIP